MNNIKQFKEDAMNEINATTFKEDDFLTFRAKITSIERVLNSKYGNPNYILKVENKSGKCGLVYTQDDNMVNHSICSYYEGRMFDITIIDSSADVDEDTKMLLSSLNQVSFW